jgi:hypothetical protein
LAENWKELEAVLNDKFVYSTPYIYYDEQEWSHNEFKRTAEGQENFSFMTPEEVCKTYPGMPLIKSKYIPIIDKKAGILAADNFIAKLRKYLLEKSQKLTVL